MTETHVPAGMAGGRAVHVHHQHLEQLDDIVEDKRLAARVHPITVRMLALCGSGIEGARKQR